MEFPQKLNIELPYDPAILLLGIFYPKKTKTLIQKDMYAPHVHCSIIDNSQNMQVSINRMDSVSYKKEWNLAICDNIEGVMLSETSQWEKEKYRMISPICRI